MSLLFVNEDKATITVEGNRCCVKYADGMKKMVRKVCRWDEKDGAY